MTNPEPPHNPWSVLLLVGVLTLVLGYYTAGFVRDYSACAVEQVKLWGKR